MKWLATGGSPIGMAVYEYERIRMMADAPTVEFSTEITELAEKLVNLAVKDAQALANCLKEVHGIEPAGGGVMMAAPAGAAAEPEEQTSFSVILANFGDKKIQVIKVVRSLTTLGLKEAKELVESCPKAIKEDVSKEEAEKIKKQIEDAGGAVTIE